MPVRAPFRSSRTAAPPRASAPKRAAQGLLLACAFGAAAYYILPTLDGRPEDLRQRFGRQRADFTALRDMIAAEPSVVSVGVDNVGDFWLFDGQWTASGKRFLIYTKTEMLETSGLSPARYQRYLDHLARVGAYRVARHNGARQTRRGTVFLFSPASVEEPAQNIIFSDRPPEPLLTWPAARRSPRTAYAKIEDGWYAEFQRP